MEENIFFYNRKNQSGSNNNGLILGTPGSGKTFLAQKEIINVLKNTDDEVYVIDTTGEYSCLLESVNGQEIMIDYRLNNFINPMDMDINYFNIDDPLFLKKDFIIALFESLINNNSSITILQKSIIDRCVKILYKEYLEHMEEIKNEEITCDLQASPILSDLYNILMQQYESEAHELAILLKPLIASPYDTFTHKTNIKINSRFVIFNLKNIGCYSENLATLSVLNFIWNRIKENQKKRKTTWIYIDELYSLIKTKSSALFLSEIWKQSRTNFGIITGITINTKDMLLIKEARSILVNTNYLYIFRQYLFDAKNLAKLYDLNEEQLNYITENYNTEKDYGNCLSIAKSNITTFKIS